MVSLFEDDIPKLSKTNSCSAGGLVFYIKRIDNIYVAYEYKSKVQVNESFEKQALIDWISINIDEIKERLNGR